MVAIADPGVTGRKPPGGDALKLALTISEFCRAHGISKAFFYLLQARGQAPRVMKVGARRLISVEEAQRWREAQTAAS